MKQAKGVIAAILIVIAAVGILWGADYLLSVKRYQDAVATMTYEHVDAAGVPDGTYIGECDVRFIYAKVSVTVQDGLITEVVLLEHRNERGKAAEGIEREIVLRQRVDVDGIAGATNSSTVIKKAVDNALRNVS